MAYLAPAEFVTKMVDAGESKLLMSTRDHPLLSIKKDKDWGWHPRTYAGENWLAKIYEEQRRRRA